MSSPGAAPSGAGSPTRRRLATPRAPWRRSGGPGSAATNETFGYAAVDAEGRFSFRGRADRSARYVAHILNAECGAADSDPVPVRVAVRVNAQVRYLGDGEYELTAAMRPCHGGSLVKLVRFTPRPRQLSEHRFSSTCEAVTVCALTSPSAWPSSGRSRMGTTSRGGPQPSRSGATSASGGCRRCRKKRCPGPPGDVYNAQAVRDSGRR